jgi:hypothetical protein
MKKLFIVALLALALSLPVQADRQFTCGFEEDNALQTMWNAGSATFVTSPVHSGTYSGLFSNNSFRRQFVSSKPAGITLYVRFEFYQPTSLPAGAASFFQWLNTSAADQNHLELLSSGKVRLVNDITATTDDSTIVLSVDTWYLIEVEYLLSETVGTLTLRINETQEAQITGEDTMNSNTLFFRFAGASGETHNIDDVAINDDSGSAPFNTWLGPGKTALQEVASDNSITWERFPTDTTNWDRVDDLPGTPDDSTTYNLEAVTLNSIDRLNAGTLPAEIPSDATIISVDVYARVGSDQASAAAMRLKLWEEDATLTNGPTVATGLNGWRILDTDEHLVFDAAGKTKADVESFDYGYENITDVATRERRVTALWVNVEWIEAAGGAAVPRRRITRSD